MLSAYEAATQNLIQPASSPIPLVQLSTLDTFINTARNHIAAEGECVRAEGKLTLVSGTEDYGFPSITAESVDAPMLDTVISVRMAYLQTSQTSPPTYQQMNLRPYEYYASVYRTQGGVGTPANVGQYKQGTFGTLVFNPVPNAGFSVMLDCVWLPIVLANDSTPEAIPQLWQDAVPFYAAWLALMNLQRQADADKAFERYRMMMEIARSSSAPSELPDNLPGGLGSQIAAQKTPLFVVGAQRPV
jgi:hypothetical protein